MYVIHYHMNLFVRAVFVCVGYMEHVRVRKAFVP